MGIDQPATLLGAIEAGGTKFVCAVGYSADNIIHRVTISTSDPDSTFGQVRSFFDEMAANYGVLSSLGIASFGPVDINQGSPKYGTILSTPKPRWSGVDLIEMLEIDCKIAVETDVNAAALGEAMAPGSSLGETVAYVTVGTGIGAGVVKNRAVLSGFTHYELGHIRIPRDKLLDRFPGRCPFHGDCLEGLACGPAIIDRWGAPLNELPKEHEAFEFISEYLSHLAFTLTLSHMPNRIVFGGGVMKSAILFPRIRKKMKSMLNNYIAYEAFIGDLNEFIVSPILGDDAGIVGAMRLAELSLDR